MILNKRIKKFLVILAFFAMITIFHKFGEIKSVFWSIFAHSAKDIFIVGLLIVSLNMKDKFDISITVCSLIYFLALFSERAYCALASDFNYEAYMKLMKSIDLSNLLVFIIFALAIVVFIPLKNERSSRTDKTES